MAPVFGPILIVILAIAIAGTVQRWLFIVIPLFLICVVWGAAFYRMDAYPTFEGQPIFMIACFVLVLSQVIILALSREKDSRSTFILAASLESEQAASEKLLTSIMPAHVSRRLKVNEVVADYHPSVTILFADLCGFTSFSSEKSAGDLVKVLDELITGFDLEASRIGVEKIKTIGDAYMAVAGLVDADRHADQAVELAQAMLRVLRDYNLQYGTRLQLRIGLNSGPVTAGIIGKTKFSYDVWGDAVNVASRMEHGSAPGFVQITDSTYQLLSDKTAFMVPVNREVKGKGVMATYRAESPPVDTAPEQKKYG